MCIVLEHHLFCLLVHWLAAFQRSDGLTVNVGITFSSRSTSAFYTWKHLHLLIYPAAWSPHYVKDKELLEKVQRRFTCMIPGLKDVPYSDGTIPNFSFRSDLMCTVQPKNRNSIRFDRCTHWAMLCRHYTTRVSLWTPATAAPPLRHE